MLCRQFGDGAVPALLAARYPCNCHLCDSALWTSIPQQHPRLLGPAATVKSQARPGPPRHGGVPLASAAVAQAAEKTQNSGFVRALQFPAVSSVREWQADSAFRPVDIPCKCLPIPFRSVSPLALWSRCFVLRSTKPAASVKCKAVRVAKSPAG